MNDRLFGMVNALLHNGYVVRVQVPNDEPHGYDLHDYEDSSEMTVGDCARKIQSRRYTILWVFSLEDWSEPWGEAIARIDVDSEEDKVTEYRDFAVDTFVAARVKEANND